ncbi:MAG: ferrochelatase [Propionicimonas sp.]|uniref:ferrochelatase n=1 Tax=Propionicimonas sp. TaxID=1955623 RepID=UPI002B20D3EF|nr:ferrochelatase [Propionicimonas sp.]MEA4943715.1 ferrochelatase [Propionicimonas sp.]MEA5054660.1 ferrochelatase [Propionicimonas sp.]
MSELNVGYFMAHVGVVLVNLGTPEAPTLPAVQRYLREFLTDRRIIPLHPLLWRPILELRVLQTHARASTEKYASVWTPDGSPLLVHAKAQAGALADKLGDTARVAVAMRYGEPSLAGVLDELKAEGIDKVLVVPMYPQFSTTTVATVLDVLGKYFQTRADQFEYRTVRDFHVDTGYIEASAARIEETWAREGRPDFAAGDKLLLSYHGIPVSMVAGGDPYPRECEATTARLRERLGLGEDECLMAYQSKFGRGEWLTPATIEKVAELGQTGVKRLDVFCPGFAADCLETEEEIGILNREEFHAHGGERFVRVPCLNDAEPWIDALAGIVTRQLAGWVSEQSVRSA